MRDPFTWSLPIGRVLGITVRVHILLVVVFLGFYLRVAYSKEVEFPAGAGIDTLILLGLLFLSILLHEFGHCYGARLMDGDAQEVLLWPLGGLASVEVPHTPRAHAVTTMMGPAVNLFLCLLAAAALASASLAPPWPVWDPFHAPLYNWSLAAAAHNGKYWSTGPMLEWWQLLAARLFFLNANLFLFNLIPAYPMDGGRLLQALLWPRLGYSRSTSWAVFVGFCAMFIMGVAAFAINESLLLGLALFIFFSCRQQWLLLETGGEEGVFGYDFSQGYTSLERGEPPAAPPKHRQPNFFQRWLQRRAERKRQREQENREADERRMDDLLDKIQRHGRQSLTDEENRFLKRVADRYRNRS